MNADIIQICTVKLEGLIRNYAAKSADIGMQMRHADPLIWIEWFDTHVTILKNLLSPNESVITETLRKEFAKGHSDIFLNREDWGEIIKNRNEGNDYCIRVMHENGTLCILSKSEIK